jgi:ATP-dependent Clp protease ATP-binding subunit ClpC
MRRRPDLIEQYLGELRHALWGSADLKERLLGEIEDHLAEGVAWERQRGAPPEEAQRRAIERFGLPRLVAELYAAEIAADGGGTMWQRFTERARRTVFNAQQEAKRLGHVAVDSEHLLLGLAREKECVATLILERMGISRFAIVSALEAQAARGADEPEEVKDLTPRGKQVIDLAYEDARSLHHNYIGTEHLLFGLIREADGLGAKVLTDLGTDLERARREMAALHSKWDEIWQAKVRLDEARVRLEEAESAFRALVASA